VKPPGRSPASARVLVSLRLRAQQTCDLARLGIASEVEPDLAEWDYGDFEARRSVDVRP
jgi:broad specificity phosphatase PhoE